MLAGAVAVVATPCPRGSSRLAQRSRAIAICAALAASAGSASADNKRPKPDYDGRGNPDAESGGHRALWIPRAVLWPVAITHDYVIRRPLGAFITAGDRRRWWSRIRDVFTFGPGQRDFAVPTAAYEFGLKPSVGAYLSTVDLGATGNDLQLHAATGGTDWLPTRTSRSTSPGRETPSPSRAKSARSPRPGPTTSSTPSAATGGSVGSSRSRVGSTPAPSRRPARTAC